MSADPLTPLLAAKFSMEHIKAGGLYPETLVINAATKLIFRALTFRFI
jgi:hypothetical protein